MVEPTTVVVSRVGRARRREVSAEQLAEHEGLVRWVVRQQWLGDLPFADALHEGRLGLWHALQTYDTSRGARFSTYAVVAIKRTVWRAVSQHQEPRSVLADHIDRPVVRSVAATVESPDLTDSVHRSQVRGELHLLVSTLPPRLSQVVVTHYGLAGNRSQSFTEIGEALGITRQRVGQLHAQALLLLAHPARSLALRRLLGRNCRQDYQQFTFRQRKLAKARRDARRSTR